MSTIRITVNGEEHTVAHSITLDALLQALAPGENGAVSPVATAVNGRHVARQARADIVLNDQDAVTTFEPISGG